MRTSQILFLCFAVISSASAQQVAVNTPYQSNHIEIYQRLKNRLNIVIENNPCGNIIAKTGAGILTKRSDCDYELIINDTAVHSVKIDVGIKRKGKTEWLRHNDYKVLPCCPYYDLHFGVSTQKFQKNLLRLIPGESKIWIGDDRFGFEIIDSYDQIVSSFSFLVTRADTVLFERKNIQGNMLTDEIKDFIFREAKENDLLIVKDAELLIYKQEKRKLNKELVRIMGGN